jgi:uncharacterized protein DUF5655
MAQLDRSRNRLTHDARTGARRPLWVCPKCGARFVNANQWHSCGRASLADWKAGMGPHARRLYERFEQMIAACGRYYVAPAKTRIAFLARVRFAGVTKVSEKGMTCSFSLPAPLESPRFVKVEEVVPGWFVHRLQVTDPRDLDDELQAWLRESYRQMGLQERFDPVPGSRLSREASSAASRSGRRKAR